jgi:hypothetical protein
MMLLALAVVLFNGPVVVPKSHWTSIPFTVAEHGSRLDVSYEVITGGATLQAVLMSRGEAGRFERGFGYRDLHSTGAGRQERFHEYISDAGQYVLLLDNRVEGRFDVTVNVTMQLQTPSSITVRTVSPERRRLIVTLSLLFFGAVLVVSARQFLKQNSA